MKEPRPSTYSFGAAVAEGVDGGEALVDADGVVGGEDGDGRAQVDAVGGGG